MREQIVSEAPAPPVPISPQEAREHLRIVGDSEDDYLALLIAAAGPTIERDTRVALGPREVTVTVPYECLGSRIGLPRGPATELIEIVRVAADGQETVLYTGEDPGPWELDSRPPGTLTHTNPDLLHADPVMGSHRVRIRYIAGSDPLPADMKLLALLLVGHWYEHREAATADGVPKEIPLGYRHIVRAMDPMTDAVS